MADVSRRDFVQAVSVAAAALALPGAEAVAAPHRVKVESRDGSLHGTLLNGAAPAGKPAAGALAITSTTAMASGAPLGGIGTGFIELRPDGCFYKWLIFNEGQWGGHLPASQRGVNPGMGPDSLQFLVRVAGKGGADAKCRRLFLRPAENDLYSLAYVQDVQSIEYEAWFPMTSLRYHDDTLPVRVSATAFSPFSPGDARGSAAPGFTIAFTLENASREAVEVSLLSLLDNPVARGHHPRQLVNTIQRQGPVTSLTMATKADSPNKTTLGSVCLAVSGGEHSFISGTYATYLNSGRLCLWRTPRANSMLLNVLQQFFVKGKLPDTSASADPTATFTLSSAQIDHLSAAEARHWLDRLSEDALFDRVISEARRAEPHVADSPEGMKNLLREIAGNLSGDLAGHDRGHSSWGAGALASGVSLPPGEKKEIRFTFSWFFPHHFSKYGEDMGHKYANWFSDAAAVNRQLVANYSADRGRTESFARTLADTSLGDPLAFCWSSHLSTAVTNTWWVKDGNYSIWEGLGCCGQSTMDVEYDASFSVVALFPELKLSQMRWMLQYQQPNGQVPHNYDGDFTHIDAHGWGRVDMNPQFVMMVCRDYRWTADKAYLRAMWPHVLKAMEYTGSLDTNGDGLPDQHTSFQTYDQWGLRGSPAYICSLWIGALGAAVEIADAAGQQHHATRWKALQEKASASFDRLLFNGKYYSLWVDGQKRDEMCMADQISGQWFTHLVGLPTAISRAHLQQALASIWKNNFTPETGLRNATAPEGRRGLLLMDNLQAGGVWSGIEYAFASCMMDHGHYAEGAELVAAVHRRYLRAGRPWNHVECGDHYSRPMSSWATLLAATGFKPDLPAKTLTLAPTAPGDFHAPWATSRGFGRISRHGRSLEVKCTAGSISFQTLRTNVPAANHGARVAGQAPAQKMHRAGDMTIITFDAPLLLKAGQALTVA